MGGFSFFFVFKSVKKEMAVNKVTGNLSVWTYFLNLLTNKPFTLHISHKSSQSRKPRPTKWESHERTITPLPFSWHLSPASTHSSKHIFSWHPASFSWLSMEENIIPCFHKYFNYIRIFQFSLLVLFICSIFTPLFNFLYGNPFCFVKETKERIGRKISDLFIPEKKFNSFSTFTISFQWWICFSVIWSLFIKWLSMEIFLSFYRWQIKDIKMLFYVNFIAKTSLDLVDADPPFFHSPWRMSMHMQSHSFHLNAYCTGRSGSQKNPNFFYRICHGETVSPQNSCLYISIFKVASPCSWSLKGYLLQ